jgi:hypothetical protein
MPRIAVAAAALALSGCSLVAVRPPFSAVKDPTAPVTCTTSGAPVVLDAFAAAAALLAVAYQSTYQFGCIGQAPDCGEAAGKRATALFGASLVLGASGIYGAVAVERCRRRDALRDLCAGGDLDACRELTPGWEPPPGFVAPSSSGTSAGAHCGEKSETFQPSPSCPQSE